MVFLIVYWRLDWKKRKYSAVVLPIVFFIFMFSSRETRRIVRGHTLSAVGRVQFLQKWRPQVVLNELNTVFL